MATAVATKLQPLGDRLVIRPLGRDEMTKSGIVLPDTAKERPQAREVLAARQGRIDDNGKRIPMEVAVGNKVLFAKYSGTEFKSDGEDLLVLSERDVLAVLG